VIITSSQPRCRTARTRHIGIHLFTRPNPRTGAVSAPIGPRHERHRSRAMAVNVRSRPRVDKIQTMRRRRALSSLGRLRQRRGHHRPGGDDRHPCDDPIIPLHSTLQHGSQNIEFAHSSSARLARFCNQTIARIRRSIVQVRMSKCGGPQGHQSTALVPAWGSHPIGGLPGAATRRCCFHELNHLGEHDRRVLSPPVLVQHQPLRAFPSGHGHPARPQRGCQLSRSGPSH
jgi:hypothetical protein